MKLIVKEGILDVGIDVVDHVFLYLVNTADEVARESMLRQVAGLAEKLDFPKSGSIHN
ncbi:hypothetical protein PAECIP111802_00282 [Paenibacillus allorhizosphaerae]|uniref:Uncharacterized protein n=2 Tax=Paenibacillus allorhizosphaerae TaxID=2849866 RepID=A0ABN7TAQ6_9BACL|nr:hypothetical protein PAECIP111802_00282 [Paenibacillus allorhizosphaerae]